MTSVNGGLRALIHEHPLKKFFREQGVTQLEVARWCGISASSASHLLGGYRPVPSHVETKMQALAAKLRETGAGHE